MTASKPKIIVTRKLPDAVETRMGELFDTEFNESDEPFSRARLIEAVKTAECLVPTVTDRIDRSLLGLLAPLMPTFRTVRHVVVMEDGGQGPDPGPRPP